MSAREARSIDASGAAQEVDDWIKSVRALKEKRQAEDEARNRQLEEDILRERKARQDRRATRTRSISPTKSLSSSVTPSPQKKDDRGKNQATVHEHEKDLLDSVNTESNAFETSLKLNSTNDSSPNLARKLKTMIAEPDSHLVNMTQRLSLLQRKEGSSLFKDGSEHELQTEGSENAKLSNSPDRPGRVSQSPKLSLLSPQLRQNGRHLFNADADPQKHKTTVRVAAGSISRDRLAKIAGVLDRQALTRTSLPNEASRTSSVQSNSIQETAKLSHMTKDRARRRKTKQPTLGRPEDSATPAVEEAMLTAIDPKSLSTGATLPSSNILSRPKSTPFVKPLQIGAFEKEVSSKSEIWQEVTWFSDSKQRHSLASSTDSSKDGSPRLKHSYALSSSSAATPILSARPSLRGSPTKVVHELEPTSTQDSPTARISTPFRTGSRSHRPTKSVVSMTGVADLIRSRANSLDIKLPQVASSPADADKITAVWSSRSSASGFQKVHDAANIIFDDEIRILQISSQSLSYLWIGRTARLPKEDHIKDLTLGQEVVSVYSGDESRDFVNIFKDLSIISKVATRPSMSSMLFVVRSYLGGFAIDEIPCLARNLCSGFAYVVLGQRNFLWTGRGCSIVESRTATAFLKEYGSAEKSINFSEGHETGDFWDVFGGRDSYASSAYWRLKRDLPLYTCELYTAHDGDVVRRKHLSVSGMKQHGVHVIDTFFEVYIYITKYSTKEDILRAITWVRNHCKSVGKGRPFVPMALALCPGSKLPRDLRAVFRFPVESENSEIRVLELSTTELLLQRSTFSLSELESGMALGVNYSKLERSVDTNDFAKLFGIDKQSFDRISASEQGSARARALEQLGISNEWAG